MICVRYNFIFVSLVIMTILINACGGGDQITVDVIKARTMGLAYLEENKLTEAEQAFKQLIKMVPDEALGYANLGLVYTRSGNFEEAKKQFKQALEIAPKDPEIHLNYAELLLLTNQEKQATDILEESLKYNPDHIRTLFKLGENYSKSQEKDTLLKAEKFLKRVVGFLPVNIAARLKLIDLLLREDKPDSAATYFEQLQAQMPEFTDNVKKYYKQSLSLMHQNKAQDALTPFNIFYNMLRPTEIYQAGFNELKGMSGPLIGTPILTFQKDFNLSAKTQQDVLDAIQFSDASEAAGLDIIPVLQSADSNAGPSSYLLTAADFDGNGTQDLYISARTAQNSSTMKYLFKNNFGKFIDISAEAGIKHDGEDRGALFIDYDNDGYLDLFLVNSTKNILYYHYAPQKFRNMADKAGLSNTGLTNAACFADFDHDGDLDLYLANQSQNAFYRNNLDGTFSENSGKMAIDGAGVPSTDAAFADFDDDGDLDLFVLNSETSNVMYSNLRQGRFEDVTKEWGLSGDTVSTCLATGDYNNDGLTDIFITQSTPPGYILYSKKNGTKYEKDLRSAEMQSVLQNYICSDVHFFDFDNDGFLDLIFAGKAKSKDSNFKGLLLFHNDGQGVFKNVSNLLPDIPSAGAQIAVADYNEDGDQDIFLSAENDRVHLLRNDGGNANHYLNVQLVGLRTGSGKNNYFGIGAKLEVKAGELYQSRIVTEPVSHFGMGQKTKADVVRVLWTNGVPQNLFEPGSDQALLEKQILKGSCPFLYAWNGEKYEFVTDVLWRSALGMPLGIMGGETAYAFSDPSQDYFRIPGEMLKEKDGNYSLQLTSELWETAYFDEVKLLLVDHPETTDVYIDERFTPPPYPPLHFFHVSEKKYPLSVIDDQGNDLSNLTRYKDYNYVANFDMQRYQGISEVRDLIIDIGSFPDQAAITLYLNGWVFPTDASINMALSQSSENLVYPPQLQVRDKKGQWQTVLSNISFPMGKNKYVILDLKNKFLSENHQVRIRTSMQIYWDYIFFTQGEQNHPLHVNTLSPKSADIHYRGFSRMYRKGGPDGPFWFDYNDVSKDPKWRDLEGYYTRYGDVLELLVDADSRYIITNAGDEITIEFDARKAPQLPKHWTRDFIIYTNGWLKDGDLNTAQGQHVLPLPFIGMSKYPYDENEHYPADEKHQQFLKNYITREVTTKDYKKWLIEK